MGGERCREEPVFTRTGSYKSRLTALGSGGGGAGVLSPGLTHGGIESLKG